MSLLSAIVRKLATRREACAPPPPRWLVLWHSGCCIERMPFVNVDEGEDINASWQVVLDATMEGYRADRIGDSIYLTGQPSGFEGGTA